MIWVALNYARLAGDAIRNFRELKIYHSHWSNRGCAGMIESIASHDIRAADIPRTSFSASTPPPG
jgi:hypothetical protein